MTLRILLLAAALLGAVLAGFYFAFATVITAHRSIPDAGPAMVRMNEMVERPPFLAVFLLSALTAAVAAVWLLASGDWTIWKVLGIAGAVCVAATFVTTMAINVPLNAQLADHAIEWTEFARTWGAWNVARTLLCAVGAGLLAATALQS